MNYRKQTSHKMSGFYNEIIKSHENVRKQHPVKEPDEEAVVEMSHEEYDVTKICSEIDPIYS
jgi:hypothetical protein